MATRIIELYHGKFLSYLGNYDYYLEKRDEMHALADRDYLEAENAKGDGRQQFLLKKAEDARKRKAENDLKKLEDEIAALEERIKEIDEEFLVPENATDSEKLTELSKERADLSALLDRKYAAWEEMV